MHVKDEKVFAKVDNLIPHIMECEQLFTEINLDEVAKYPTQIFKMPNDLRINQLLAPKRIKKVHKILKKSFDFDLNSMDQNYPLLVINRLAESVLSAERQIPLDSFLWIQAKKNNIDCDGLESIQGQIKVLKTIPISFQLKQLVSLSKNVGKFRKLTLQLLKYYQDEDIQMLYHQAKKSMGKYRNTMIYDRNLNMAEAIDSHQTKKHFYVVGAAHLYGKYGVLTHLKKRAWKVKRVRI